MAGASLASPLMNILTFFLTILTLDLPSLTTAYAPLSSPSLHSLPRPGSTFSLSPSDSTTPLLSPILIPRVSGTPGNDAVRTFFRDFFTTHLPSWTLTHQNSTSKTPATGSREIPFSNLILRRSPPWSDPNGEVSYLTLVAHFDSKLTPTNFIGATDSAAPCAMLLHVAKTLESALAKKWAYMAEHEGADGNDPDQNKGLQILLLDGEEAFKSWTSTDSIYGARSLAAEWEVTPHVALSTYRTPLDSIELFVLLDLLGAEGPRVPSYFLTTHWAYKKMADMEGRLRGEGLMRSERKKRTRGDDIERGEGKRVKAQWFFEEEKKDSDRWLGGQIGDDHEPFLARGVEILHVIPTPFPRVWHDMSDDGEHLDMDTTEDWAVLVTAFTAEWFELDRFLGGESGGAEKVKKDGCEVEIGEKRKREKEQIPAIEKRAETREGVYIRDELLSD